MFLEGVPLVTEPQNQPVWLTIGRHRSCYVLLLYIVAQKYPRVTQIGIHRGGKMCAPLEWFPYTLNQRT